MNRRGFMRGMLALGAAPAVVSSGVLMPIKLLLLPSEEQFTAYGVAEEFSLSSDPVNFVLMRELLKAARKRLPYFEGTLPGAVVPAHDAVTVRWDKVASGFYLRGVPMTQAG